MQGIIITIEKEELEDIVSKAVETALEKSGFFKRQEESEDIDEFIMKAPQLCTYLKMKLSILYQLTHKNEIPFNKRGKLCISEKTKLINGYLKGNSQPNTNRIMPGK